MMSSKQTHFQKSILYTLLSLLLLTCPMKREVKQALDIPIHVVALGEINNQSLCNLLAPAARTTSKQANRITPKAQFESSSSLSLTSLATRISTQQRVDSDKMTLDECKLFIYYRKLLI